MDIGFLTEKIEDISKNSESEEVRLLALIMQVKSEFDSENMAELKDMHKKQLQILENHTKILDKLTNRTAEQDTRITQNEEEIIKIRNEFEQWRKEILRALKSQSNEDIDFDEVAGQ